MKTPGSSALTVDRMDIIFGNEVCWSSPLFPAIGSPPLWEPGSLLLVWFAPLFCCLPRSMFYRVIVSFVELLHATLVTHFKMNLWFFVEEEKGELKPSLFSHPGTSSRFFHVHIHLSYYFFKKSLTLKCQLWNIPKLHCIYMISVNGSIFFFTVNF
jgi:hypothetical protein